jgi:hypothetical protein
MAQTAAHLADRVIPPVAGGKFWAANHGSCIDALPAQMAGTNPEKQDKTASIRHTANLTGEEREEYCEGNFGAAAKVSADFCPGMGRSTFKKKSGVESIHLFLLLDTIVDDGFEQVRFIAPRLA